MSLPAVNVVNNNLTMESVISELGQNDRPDYPIDATCGDDTKANNAVKVVRQSLVDAVTIARGDERRNYKVDIAEEEEDGDRQRSSHRRVPVVLLLVKVDPGETCCDKYIDDGKRVRDTLSELVAAD